MAVCNLACEGLTNALVTTDQAQRKLYIGGLSPETSTEILLNFFRRHGEIEEGSVAYDKDTNKSRYKSSFFVLLRECFLLSMVLSLLTKSFLSICHAVVLALSHTEQLRQQRRP